MRRRETYIRRRIRNTPQLVTEELGSRKQGTQSPSQKVPRLNEAYYESF